MRYATLTSLGGELIEASQADYEDYKSFLRCPECGEPVFLRKRHKRGTTEILDAFIHHKAIPEVSICENRVGKYDAQTVRYSREKARGQRLSTLRLSMWKFLKTNLAVNLKNWSASVKYAETNLLAKEMAAYGEEVLIANTNFFINHTFPKIAESFRNQDERIIISLEIKQSVEAFLKIRERDWQLHYKITQEALELFLSPSSMREIRHRICCMFSFPKILECYPELLTLTINTDEWRRFYIHSLFFFISIIFLTVDWIKIWDKKDKK
ncbi:MAG TPA: hypothetical protein V6D13_18415 [Halomicronema sp.]